MDLANDSGRRAPGNSRSDLEDLQDRGRNFKTAFWVTDGVALAAGVAAGVVFLLGAPRACTPCR
jgi:hypothetical protein